MNIEKAYDELCQVEQLELKGDILQKKGMFRPNDLVNVFHHTYFFSIDKKGMLEILQNIIDKINYKNEDISSFNYFERILIILGNELNSYFGDKNKEIDRLIYYLKKGNKGKFEDERICSLSQLRSTGVAECAEKVSVANNILLMLVKLGLLKEEIVYLNGLLNIDGISEGHAFLAISHVGSQGNKINLVYDVINPECYIYNDKEYYYPALYRLSEQEYRAFLNGQPFDNSKFLFSNIYTLKYKRTYSGYNPEENGIKPKTN